MPNIASTLSDSLIDEVNENAPSLGASPPYQRKSPKKTFDGYMTLGAVAAEIGVTREYARQIEKQALEKCRLWLERNGLLEI